MESPRQYGPMMGGYFKRVCGGGLLQTLIVGKVGQALGFGDAEVGELFEGDGDGETGATAATAATAAHSEAMRRFGGGGGDVGGRLLGPRPGVADHERGSVSRPVAG